MQALTVLFPYPSPAVKRPGLLLYYLYCLCKSVQRSLLLFRRSFRKAGAKVRTFTDTFQIISEVFSEFLFSLVSLRASLPKFPCRIIMSYKTRGVGENRKCHNTVSCQDVNVSPLPFSKADAKVGISATTAILTRNFFERNLKLCRNTLITNHVV